MTAPRMSWIAIAVFLGLFPAWAEAQCPGQIGPARDGLGELCPGRIWNPAGFQMFQDATYNKGRDEYLINTSTWDGVNGESIATTLYPDGSVSTVTINISGFGGTGINGVTAVATEYNSVRGGYLATWRMAQAPQQIYARYLGDDGTPISPVFGIGSGDPPSIAYSPQADRYLVTWSKLISGIYYTYYALIAGDPTSATPLIAIGLIDSNALSAVTAYNPTSQLFLIVFVKDFAPSPRRADIFGRTVSPSGVLGGVYPINTNTKDQQRPVLAASPHGFGVLYEDWNSGGSFPNAVGMLLDPNGAVLPMAIAAGTSPTWEVSGAVTYSAATDSYVVAWRSAGNVGLPQHYLREFDASTGAPREAAIVLTTQDSAILSAAARSVPSAPQALVLWGVGAAAVDGVHAGIHPLPRTITTLVSVGNPGEGVATIQPFTVSGWAADPAFPTGTGVDTVHVWAFPSTGPGVFLGESYGVSRPDVAAYLGDPRFQPSGFNLTVNSLPDGNYTLGIFAKSTLSAMFDTVEYVDIKVGSDPRMNLDAPTPGQTLVVPFEVRGWAIDRAAPSGTGVDTVHVWAFPAGGGPATFVGAANYGVTRPGVAAAYGAQFESSGFSLNMSTYLPAGTYTLTAYAHSTVSGTFNNTMSVAVTIEGTNYLTVDRPWANGNVAVPFEVKGWALNTGGVGVGVDKVDVWAIANASGTPTFLGTATLGLSRPGVAAYFGEPRFEPSGFSLMVNTALPAGGYKIRVFARSSSSGLFEISKEIPTTVNVGSTPLTYVDAPVGGSMVSSPFEVRGWAIDLGASSGTGVNAVHVWAFPSAGGSPIFLGAATLGLSRPGVAAFVGNPNFTLSGYTLTATTVLPSGSYTIQIFARSTVSGAFVAATPVNVLVP